MQSGIVYLIQPEEFIGTQIYKIGYSNKSTLDRCATGYKSKSKYICVMDCVFPFKAEEVLKMEFNANFKLHKGREYFEGDEATMFSVFVDIVKNHKLKYSPDKKNNNDSPFELDKTKLKLFDTTYFDTLPSYTTKKLYFEEFVFKVTTPEVYYVYKLWDSSTQTTQHKIYTIFELVNNFDNLVCDKKEFIKIWKNDKQIKTYEKMVFEPYNGIELDDITQDPNQEPTIYNIFKGYNRLIDIKTVKDFETAFDIIYPWIAIIMQLCEDTPEYEEYYLNWISHLIQYPNIKLPIAMMFMAENSPIMKLHFDAINDLIGNQYAITCDETDFNVERFITNTTNKILINYNDCDEPKKFEKIIDTFTTDSITTPNKIDNLGIQNNASAIIIYNSKLNYNMTHHKKHVQFFSYDNCPDNTIYDCDFNLDRLTVLFKSPIFLSSLYYYLTNWDMGDWHVRKTHMYTRAIEYTLMKTKPIEILFLKDCIIDYTQPTIKIKGTELYETFDVYIKTLNNQSSYNIKKFYSNLDSYRLKNLKKYNENGTIHFIIKSEELDREMTMKQF